MDHAGGNRILDPYKILGVSRDATQEEIRERYLYLMSNWNPDTQTWNPNTFRDDEDSWLAEEQGQDSSIPYSTPCPVAVDGIPLSLMVVSGLIGLGAGYFVANQHFGKFAP